MAWPTIIGSETFIMVASRCNDNKIPLFFASAICSCKYWRKALQLIIVASTTSPFCRGLLAFNTVVLPSSPTIQCAHCPAICSVIVVDFSLA